MIPKVAAAGENVATPLQFGLVAAKPFGLEFGQPIEGELSSVAQSSRAMKLVLRCVSGAGELLGSGVLGCN